MINLLALIPGKGKLVLGLVVMLALASAVAYHYWKINGLTEDLTTAREDLAQAMINETVLKDAMSELEQSQQLLIRQREIDQEKINQLSKNFRASRERVSDLRRLLSRHELGYLMLEKPGLIENRMNNATKQVGIDFESLTSPEKKGETDD